MQEEVGGVAPTDLSLGGLGMSEAPNSRTPLRATFKINLNGETVPIATVGQAYRFITNLSSIEWMEFRSLHGDAVASLRGAADNAIMTVQATTALRVLFARAKLLQNKVARRWHLLSLDIHTQVPELIRLVDIKPNERVSLRRIVVALSCSHRSLLLEVIYG